MSIKRPMISASTHEVKKDGHVVNKCLKQRLLSSIYHTAGQYTNKAATALTIPPTESAPLLHLSPISLNSAQPLPPTPSTSLPQHTPYVA